MQDQQPPAPPAPPPPAPPAPAPPEAGNAAETAPLHDGPPADAEEAPPAEPISPVVPEGGDAPITPEAPAEAVPGIVEAGEPVNVPVIPDIADIAEGVKRACLKDGIPEAEFAKDFHLGVEVREKLLLDCAQELTGVRPQMSDEWTNVAAKITTVGALIAFFEESHPDHPTATGAGS